VCRGDQWIWHSEPETRIPLLYPVSRRVFLIPATFFCSFLRVRIMNQSHDIRPNPWGQLTDEQRSCGFHTLDCQYRWLFVFFSFLTLWSASVSACACSIAFTWLCLSHHPSHPQISSRWTPGAWPDGWTDGRMGGWLNGYRDFRRSRRMLEVRT
jgi:hypothetical protein